MGQVAQERPVPCPATQLPCPAQPARSPFVTLARAAPKRRVSEDMGVLAGKGVNSFKFFMAYKGALMVNDEQLLAGMRRCKELGALAQVGGCGYCVATT